MPRDKAGNPDSMAIIGNAIFHRYRTGAMAREMPGQCYTINLFSIAATSDFYPEEIQSAMAFMLNEYRASQH